MLALKLDYVEALNDLVRMGKVRYIDASSMWAWQFAKNECRSREAWSPPAGGKVLGKGRGTTREKRQH